MLIYSYSKIQTFKTCPLKFKFRYIDRIEPEIKETIESFMGKIVHETLEKLYRNLQFKKLLSKSELIELYNYLWNEKFDDSILVVNGSADDYKDIGEKYISDYYDSHMPFDDAKTIGLETKRYVELQPGYKMHIRIDRLSLTEDKQYEIHDYKTSKRLPNNISDDKQLVLYAYGVSELYPLADNIKLIWHYLAFNKDLILQPTKEELENIRKESISDIDIIESCQDFQPRKSKLCNWCEYQNICPLFSNF